MADIQARMRQLIGTTAQWAADDIVIGDGEIAVERVDTGDIKMKIGNGVDPFSLLPYISTSAFGEEYSWRVPAGRSYGVDYTAPNHPIMVSHISGCLSNDGQTNIIVDGATVAQGSNGGNGAMTYTLTTIVPPNTVYRITQSNLNTSTWLELRAD